MDQKTLALMKRAKPCDEFLSSNFNIAGLTWKFQAYPNGNSDDRAGTFDLFVKLVTIPETWKYVFCFRRVQCDQTKGSFAFFSTFQKGSSKGWLKTMVFSEIQSLNKLSFTVEIIISRIVLKEEDTIFYQKPIDIEAQQIRWNMDNELWKCIQNAHDGKYISSEIFGQMWCVSVERHSTLLKICLNLCALPKDLQTVKAMWNIECILEEKGMNKKITNSRINTWEMDDNGSILGSFMLWRDSELPLKLIKQCDSMEIKVDINPDPDRVATEHWQRLANPMNIDQKEKEIEIEVEVDPENVSSRRRDKRFDLIEARVDSLVSSIDQLTSKVDQISKQSTVLQDQRNKSVESKFDQMEQRITLKPLFFAAMLIRFYTKNSKATIFRNILIRTTGVIYIQNSAFINAIEDPRSGKHFRSTLIRSTFFRSKITNKICFVKKWF